MAMSEIVERVARAICISKGWNPDDQVIRAGGRVPMWSLETEVARAAIAAGACVNDISPVGKLSRWVADAWHVAMKAYP